MHLFTIGNLPLYYKHGKSARKIMMNAILSMQWHKRKTIHDTVQNVMEIKLASIPPIAVGKEDRFKFQWVFYRDKSTGRVDLSNFAYLIKVIEDSIAKKMGIDDSIAKTIEHRIIYGGMRAKEELTVTVIKTNDIVPIKLNEKLDKIYEILGIDKENRKDDELIKLLL